MKNNPPKQVSNYNQKSIELSLLEQKQTLTRTPQKVETSWQW